MTCGLGFACVKLLSECQTRVHRNLVGWAEARDVGAQPLTVTEPKAQVCRRGPGAWRLLRCNMDRFVAVSGLKASITIQAPLA